jgi:CBS domain containing-hemolysin-like protein
MWIVKALGGKPQSAGLLVTEEQIEDMVRIGSEAGALESSRGELLQGVFDLKDATARKLLTPRTQVVGLSLDAKWADIMTIVQEHKYSRYPVYDKGLDNIVGVFFAKTLFNPALAAHPGAFVLSQHLKKALFVPEAAKATDLLADFQRKRTHLAIVVDEHGGTAGILTLEDVLEELVGDIEDEHDEPERHVVEVSEGRWTLDGGADLRAFSEQIGADLPESEAYATVGGFLTDQLGRMPGVGDKVYWQDLVLHVTESDGMRVVRVDIERHDLPVSGQSTPRGGQRGVRDSHAGPGGG